MNNPSYSYYLETAPEHLSLYVAHFSWQDLCAILHPREKVRFKVLTTTVASDYSFVSPITDFPEAKLELPQSIAYVNDFLSNNSFGIYEYSLITERDIKIGSFVFNDVSFVIKYNERTWFDQLLIRLKATHPYIEKIFANEKKLIIVNSHGRVISTRPIASLGHCFDYLYKIDMQKIFNDIEQNPDNYIEIPLEK